MRRSEPGAATTQVAMTVKALRKSRGMSQCALGDEVGLHRMTIDHIEKGTRAHVSVDELVSFAEAFNVPPASLLDGTALIAEASRAANAMREEANAMREKADRIEKEALMLLGKSAEQ